VFTSVNDSTNMVLHYKRLHNFHHSDTVGRTSDVAINRSWVQVSAGHTV